MMRKNNISHSKKIRTNNYCLFARLYVQLPLLEKVFKVYHRYWFTAVNQGLNDS